MATTTATRVPRPRPLLAIVHQVNLRPGHDTSAPVAEVMTARELETAFASKKTKKGNAGAARVPAPRNPTSGVLATATSIEYATGLLVRLYDGDPETAAELAADLVGKNQTYVSRIIDNLLALLADQPRPATDAMVAMLRRLYYSRMAKNDGTRDEVLDAAFEASIGQMDFTQVGKMIDTLKTLPEHPALVKARYEAQKLHAVTEGMYRLPNGEIYKVQKAIHGSGHLYAKKLVKLDEPTTVRGQEAHYAFEMARGAIQALRPEYRMTREDAKEFGDLYGCCCRCGTVLTDEASIERGLGPICAEKF